MPKPNPIAIACSDLHLTLTRPRCRKETDWLAVQAGYLKELKTIAGNLPILCAGDIFDQWHVSPELINFALQHLPDRMVCVPGQHDLPNHQIEDMHKSGYGVLEKAGKITDISDKFMILPDGQEAWGFGWNQKITEPVGNSGLSIAVIHRYVWSKGASYPGAPETVNVGALAGQLKGYDIAITGDNHIGFTAKAGNCTVFNCGGFIRRKSDEIDYRPRVGIIYSDGTVQAKSLDTSRDEFYDIQTDRPAAAFDMQDFIHQLGELGEHGLDFRETVKAWVEKEDLDNETRQVIKQAMESQV